MENFTPVSGLVGGLLIDLAAALLLVPNGRIGGISGIVGGLLAFGGRDVGWRAAFVAVPAFRVIPRRQRPVLDDGFVLPRKSAVDGRLVGGAALFGVGWGMVGFCPGPAVAALTTGLTPAFVFVAAMVSGMAIHKRSSRSARVPAP